MRQYYKICAVVVCLSLFPHLVLGVCEDGWIQSGLFCYFFSTNATSQPRAQASCEVGYADLLYIDDDGENVFVYNNGPAITNENYWIGYSQVFGTIWRWASTGKAGSYRKWDIGEPDDEGGCARLTPYIQGVWRDWDCAKKLLYVCKKYADCGPPGKMELGTYTLNPDVGTVTNDTVVPQGATATYKCLNGREYPDESVEQVSTCSVGGVWYPDLPNDYPCEPKQCDPPPLFGDTTKSNGTELTRAFDTVIYYECEDGYWFDQFSDGEVRILTCAFDKTWKGPEVNECTKRYCVRPITSYARADTPLNSFGTIATYYCELGYRYGDNTTVKTFECTNDGWVPSPTPCEEMECPEFQVKNAEPSTDSLAVFVEVVWTCVKGMRYPDTTTRKSMNCQLDESWDKKITAGCEKKRCLGVPPNGSETFEHDWNITNGEVYRFEDQVNYTCIDPTWYFSDGLRSRQVTCNEDGEWSPQVVTDCVGEIIEIVTAFVHEAKESEGSATFGTIALIIVGVIMGLVVLLDIATIGKHLGTMRDNVCGPPQPKEEKPEMVEDLDEV